MRALVHIVLSTEEEKIYREICDQLKTFHSNLSISPAREYFRMNNACEFYVTLDIEKNEIQDLLDKLSSSFDVNDYEDSWECYGITSKIFHKDIYSIHFDLYD